VNVILGATGSVAAIKYWRLMKALLDEGYDVKGVLTEKGGFFARKALDHMSAKMTSEGIEWEVPEEHVERVVTEESEWEWDKIGDPIPHIDLRDWADMMVIAPLSANTMAKMANGICDNLLTSIYRAWPLLKKPVVVAPAMNTQMWVHPITRDHLDKLRNFQFQYRGMGDHTDLFKVVQPVESNLACGTKGVGAMAPIDRIVEAVKTALENSS
jgi:phosphopantothenoylcysteine decarboxylase